MRAITLVKRFEFEFSGNVVKNAITLGDVDNDGSNELIVGNQNGDVCIFKGQNKIQKISKLGPISCIRVGDVINQDKNVLIVITADGWCYLYSAVDNAINEFFPTTSNKVDIEQVDGQIFSSANKSIENSGSAPTTPKSIKEDVKGKFEFVCIHIQRIPANTKCILLGDIDGDGSIEMVLGLTDRVVRSYRWMGNPQRSKISAIDTNSLASDLSDKLLGKFVALNKWECANQIGSITLHHSNDGKVALMISQPGGTFMRIKCPLECSPVESENLEESGQNNSVSSTGESSSAVDYQFLGINRMRNPNISTEILGDLRPAQQITESSQTTAKASPYALATLDGTIMLVQDEVIIWAFAVDHQVFALTKFDITGNGSDDIVVCSWDGQTYILDQDKNSVRFHLDEAVQAFEAGYYGAIEQEPDVTSFVYSTFKNSILVYYDITLKELTCEKFDPEKYSIDLNYIRDRYSSMKLKSNREIIQTLLYET